jgi:hypothetical protein
MVQHQTSTAVLNTTSIIASHVVALLFKTPGYSAITNDIAARLQAHAKVTCRTAAHDSYCTLVTKPKKVNHWHAGLHLQSRGHTTQLYTSLLVLFKGYHGPQSQIN